MSKGIFFTTLFFVFGMSTQVHASTAKKNACEKDIQVTEAKLKKSFDKIWEDIDSAVGVEFFLVVLKGNNRMPASDEDSSTAYYSKLLKGMKKTSNELKENGLKLDAKKVKNTEELISALEKVEKCTQLVSKN